MKQHDKALESYHRSALKALDRLHYLAVMTETRELWVSREESKKSVPHGFALHLCDLRKVKESRPCADSMERHVMLEAAMSARTAPYSIGAVTGTCAHEAVYELAARVLDLASPRPVTFEEAVILAEFWLPSVLPQAAREVEAVDAVLKIEYFTARNPDKNRTLIQKSQPTSPNVQDLCFRLRKGLKEGVSQIAIAREFTGETSKTAPEAEALLRQARRYRHLWKT